MLMFTMINPTVNSYQLMINLTDTNKHTIELAGSEFQIAFGLADGLVLPPSIGYFDATYTVRTPDKEDSTGRSKRYKIKNLKLKQCEGKEWKIDT